MNKPKPTEQKPTAACPPEQGADPLDIEALVARLQRSTCTGDVRDFLLNRLKHDHEALPWNALTEDKQRYVIEQAADAARHLVEKIVRMVAADGQKVITGSMEKVMVSKDIVATMKFTSNDTNLLALYHAKGTAVMIIVADESPYVGERAPVTPDPDQPELPAGEDEGAGDGEDGEGHDPETGETN